MMGYDPYGGYGFFPSSSSNLSPLAPPFTVDRTVLNLSTNPSVSYNFMNPPPPFIELPPPPPKPYVAPPPPPLSPPPQPYIAPPPPPSYTGTGMYDPSLPIWGMYSNPTSVPVVDHYGSFYAEGDYSMWARDPCADSVKTAVDKAKPYHLSYVPPPLENKGSLGGGLDDSTNDFLSTCLSSLGSTSRSDNTSGLNQLDSSLNGFNDIELGYYADPKWDSILYSSEKNAAGSPLCMDYLKPGIPSSAATKYDEVKQSSKPLFWKPLTIGTTHSQPNMDLSRQNDESSCKSGLGVDYPHLTLNSNKFEVGNNPSRYSLYPESIGRDDANASLTEPHLPRTDSQDRYSFNLNEIKVNESVDNSSKSFDPYNPAEDSPCWKGATSSQFSLFADSHASAPQPLLERPSYVRDVSQELGHSDNLNSTKPEAFVPEHHCNWVFASPINPPLKDASLTSEKYAEMIYLVEKEKNANESFGMDSLHVPNQVHNAHDNSIFTNLNEESTPKIDLAAMIKTMHNLSDLLLFYCSNDEFALKEQEHVALKHVISNINSCMSKNAPSTLKRKSGFSADLCQDANVTNITAAIAIYNVDDHLANDKGSPNVLPCTEDEESHDFRNVHNVSDLGKSDEMTQAIKNVLSEKFNSEEERLPQALLYKNLWLEAEAVICATNFKARFDRVKNEMEKSSPLTVQVADDGIQDMIDMESPHSEIYPDVKLVNNLNGNMTSSIKNSPMISKSNPTDDVMARFSILKSRDNKSTSMSPVDTVKDVSSCASDADISIPDLPIGCQINHEDDVLAGFHILASRGENSASMSTPQTKMHPIFRKFPALEYLNIQPKDTCMQESPLCSKTHGSNDADDASRGENSASMSTPQTKMHPIFRKFPALEYLNIQPKDTCMQESPLCSKTHGSNDADDALRGENSASMSTPQTKMHPIFRKFPALEYLNIQPKDTCMQESPLCSKAHGSNDADDAVMARLQILKCRADKNDETVDTGISSDLQNYADENKLTTNKTDLEMSFQSCDEEEVENQNSAGWYDGPSLDWEHVLKDDFVCQK